jgi:ABC-type lipoprotein export system ATPase subunit
MGNTDNHDGANRTPVVEITDLTKVSVMGATEVRALRGVSLTIDEGEYVAIIGASGSGKSTLMNMIGLLDRPTNGSYRIAVRRQNRRRYAQSAPYAHGTAVCTPRCSCRQHLS